MKLGRRAEERHPGQIGAQPQGAVHPGQVGGRLIPGGVRARQRLQGRLDRHEAVALRQEAQVLVAEPAVDPLRRGQHLARAARAGAGRVVAEQGADRGGAVVALVADAAGVAVLARELVQVALQVAVLLGGEPLAPEVVERLGAVARVHPLEEEDRHVAPGHQLLQIPVLDPRGAHVEDRASDGGVERALGQRRQGELAVWLGRELEPARVGRLVHLDRAQPRDVGRV